LSSTALGIPRHTVMKVVAGQCDLFCRKYDAVVAVVDTEEKYEDVYELIKKTNKELNVNENYTIGLKQRKWILGMNK
jgi:hypothetical protein